MTRNRTLVTLSPFEQRIAIKLSEAEKMSIGSLIRQVFYNYITSAAVAKKLQKLADKEPNSTVSK